MRPVWSLKGEGESPVGGRQPLTPEASMARPAEPLDKPVKACGGTSNEAVDRIGAFAERRM